jgi:RHS repeat-associated protein
VIDLKDFSYWAAHWDVPTGHETDWYYLTDALGNVRGLVGGRFNREGDREFYNYDVYGKLSLQNPEERKSGNPYLFAGYRFDPETGLYHTHYRTYDPETGRWIQFDPIGNADSMNLYEYVVNNPANFVDPLGLLQRRQVDYLAYQWIEGWPGVDDAVRITVRDAIRIIKKKLKGMYPDADFDNSLNWKNNKDDVALQKIINESKKNPDTENCRIWNNFPGSVKTPNNCKQIVAHIKGALYRFREFGGNLEGVNEALLASWAMRESSWDSSASAYASSAPYKNNPPKKDEPKMSTAIGLLQVTQSTYNNYTDRRLFPRNNELWNVNIGRVWDEKILSNPYSNMIAGLFVLQGKPGNSLSQKLANYYGSSSAANRNYADKILKGAERLTEFLNGRNLYDLNPKECDYIKSELDKIVH